MLQSIQRDISDSGMVIQPALEIGESDDEYEKEANSVADKVMKMNDDRNSIQMKENPSSSFRMMDKEEELIQKKTDGSNSELTASKKTEEGINSTKGSGQSLPHEFQEEMGRKMGSDFSSVKIHTNNQAVQMNKEIGAKAFTHGNDIYFNSGQYNTSSQSGKHLLAHELTHTIQQTGKISRIQRLTDDEVREYVVYLSTNHTIEGKTDSKEKARAAYFSWKQGKQFLNAERKSLIIQELIFAGAEPMDSFKIRSILDDSDDVELREIIDFNLYGLSVDILISRVNLGTELLKRIRILETVESAYDALDYEAIAKTAFRAIKHGPHDTLFVSLQKMQQHPDALKKFNDAFNKLHPDGAEHLIRKKMEGQPMQLALELLGLGADARSMVELKHISSAELNAAAARLQLAIVNNDETELYRILIPFNRNKTQTTDLKSYYTTLTGNNLITDIVGTFDTDEASYAQYLLDAPQSNRSVNIEANAAMLNNRGKESRKTKGRKGEIPGGDIDARTRTQITGNPGDWFNFNYEGGLSEDSFWLQFIWREIIVWDPNGKRRLNDLYNYQATGGVKQHQLSNDPDAPIYEVDSGDPKIVNPGSPAYEVGGGDNRDTNLTEMFDQPSNMAPYAVREFNFNNATKVVSKAHFDTFLIRDNRPVFHNTLVSTWKFNNLAAAVAGNPDHQKVTHARKVNKMPDDMRAVLAVQYPNYNYIR